MCISEKTFLHFANCTQIESRFCELCNLHKLIRVLQCVDLKDISSFCKLHSNWKPLLRIVQFAQITQIDNGTILQRVHLKRHFFNLQIALKLKTAFANCVICALRSSNEQIWKDISSFCRLHSNWKLLLQIVQFAQITQIDNGTPMCRSEKIFLRFADCTQIENRFCELCNLHKLHKLITVRSSNE